MCFILVQVAGSAGFFSSTSRVSPFFGREPALAASPAAKRIKIGVFTFNILNLGAAGYDASISNLFMALLAQDPVFEVMNRKELEESLRRAGLQQSEDVSVVHEVGNRLGLDMILFGNIKKVGSCIQFQLKLVEISRGDVVLHRKAEVFGDIALRQQVEEFTREIELVGRNYQPATVEKAASPVRPQAPSGLQARGGSRKATISWAPNPEPNLGGYKVYRSTTPTGPFSKIATVFKNTFVDPDLENNRTYYYKVKAFNEEMNEGPASGVIAAETAPTPFSPIILDAKPLIGGIRIRWTPSPRQDEKGTEVRGFKIYRAGEPRAEYREIATIPIQAEDRYGTSLIKYEYEDANLEDDSSYFYRLTAFNDKKIESDFSSTLEARTVARPTGIQATGNMIREIHLHWHPSSLDVVAGYRIYRSTAHEGPFERIAELTGLDKTSHVDDMHLKDATTYYYRLTVFDEQGRESGPSEVVWATTRGEPPTPEGLRAQSGEVKQVSLSWKVRPEKEVKGYCLYRNTKPTGQFEQIVRIKGRENATYTDRGSRNHPLGDNSTYYYMITSFNKVEVQSAPSAPVSATTKPRPRPPAGLKAQEGLPRKVILSWSPNPEPDLEVFHIWRQNAEEGFEEIEKVPGDRTRFTDEGLDHGASYQYRLQAEDKDGLLSDFSATVTATTKPLPQAPSGLEVYPLPRGFVLHWQPNPEPDIVTYKIYLKSFLADKEIGSTEKSPFTITTLEPDEEYSLVVTAVDQDGLESPKSIPVTVHTK